MQGRMKSPNNSQLGSFISRQSNIALNYSSSFLDSLDSSHSVSVQITSLVDQLTIKYQERLKG